MRASRALGKRRGSALLLSAALLAGVSAADSPSEDSVKAVFVLNFAKYARWPAASAADGGPLEICELVPDALGGELGKLDGTAVAGRPVRVRQAGAPEQWRDCDVLFIPAAEMTGAAEALGRLDSPTLTVSDSPGFAQAGGMIGLKQRAGRVRFDVNLGVVRRNGLDLGSQLLQLADEVLR